MADSIFDKIYAEQSWKWHESLSGPGSDLGATKGLIKALPHLFRKYGIRSIVDFGCGDFNWMKEVNLDGIDYLGADSVSALVNDNIIKYASDNINFANLDIISDPVPSCHLVIVRDVYVHFKIEDIIKSLNNIYDSNVLYIMMTHYPTPNEDLEKFYELPVNSDLEATGLHRPLDFTLAPFHLNQPIEILEESEVGKTLAMWNIGEVRNVY